MNLKNERQKRGLIQSDVAKAMGMAQPAYARIETVSREPTKQQRAAFRMAMMLFDAGMWADLLCGKK